MAYGNLGCAYQSQGDVSQAITYHAQDLAIAKEVGDRMLIVVGKGSTPGRKSTTDDRADAASRVNEFIGPGHTKKITVMLPLYTEDGTSLVTYHRDPALPFYYYIKEDNVSRARGLTVV